jgi:uncharacterized protein
MRLHALLRPIFVAGLLGLVVVAAWAATAVPPLQKRVTDLTDTLSPQTVAVLEQRLAALEQERGAQVAVLMLPSVRPESIEEYAVRVFEQWKLGRKGFDDGVLLVIALNDRQLRIEVGYGLEGALNDATAKRIISDDIVPHLKRGDVDAGVEAGVSRIVAVVRGERLPVPASVPRPDAIRVDIVSPFWFFAALLAFKPVTALLSLLGRFAEAAGTGAMAGWLAWLFLGHALFGLAVGVFVCLLTLLGSLAGGARGGGWHSGGGFWSSGGGGFSSGGGFGGGGGRSGGGGASGSW